MLSNILTQTHTHIIQDYLDSWPNMSFKTQVYANIHASAQKVFFLYPLSRLGMYFNTASYDQMGTFLTKWGYHL